MTSSAETSLINTEWPDTTERTDKESLENQQIKKTISYWTFPDMASTILGFTYSQPANAIFSIRKNLRKSIKAHISPLYNDRILLVIGEREYTASKVKSLFQIARDQIFEDGIETEFSKGLVDVIQEYGNLALDMIENLLMKKHTNPGIIAETLRWLGKTNHPETHYRRLEILTKLLSSSSARIRDGALIGIGSMNDPRSVNTLKRAILREIIPDLKQDMQEVLAYLETQK